VTAPHPMSRGLTSDTERRGAFLIVAAVLLTAAIGLSVLHGHSQYPTRPARASASSAAPPPTRPTSTSSAVSTPSRAAPNPAPRSRAQINRTQDQQNHDPRFRARLRRDLQRRPAFQRLPYDVPGVVIQLAGTARNGRLLLAVTYHGPLAGARRAYRRFLARYGDSGRSYHPVYRRQP
jgi:hypothetical protein